LLLIGTAFNLSVVGITGIFGDQLMQINQFLKVNALAGLGNAYLCLEEHEEAIASYQKSLAICEEIEHRQGSGCVGKFRHCLRLFWTVRTSDRLS
jgi:tetratricopeptide (TPR) repeat protein